MPVDPNTHVQVYRVDLPPDQAAQMLDDPAALQDALGAAPQRDRLQLIDPSALAGIGLASYLAEGEGVDAQALSADKTRLDQVRAPVLLLLPGALPRGTAPTPQPPLSHLGDYPLVSARGAEGSLSSTSAEGTVVDTPSPSKPPMSDKRQSGMVAMVALAVALLIALVMVLVAA